jgi:hypothetical protein
MTKKTWLYLGILGVTGYFAIALLSTTDLQRKLPVLSSVSPFYPGMEKQFQIKIYPVKSI